MRPCPDCRREGSFGTGTEEAPRIVCAACDGSGTDDSCPACGASPREVQALTADAKRWRWLFDDPALQEFARAVETGEPLPNLRTEILHHLLGFVTERQAIEAVVDKAMQEEGQQHG